jgi:O-antigen ligase
VFAAGRKVKRRIGRVEFQHSFIVPPQLALFIGVVFVILAFRSDRKRGIPAPDELFWPTLWYMVVSSRAIGIWFNIWEIPISDGGSDPTEGSQIDRWFFVALIFFGLRILIRRKFQWSAAFQSNPWLTALIVFMAVSILWSQYPYVSFKRYIKVIGSVVMAMVVLTNERPFEAFLTVLRRGLYVHLPLSVVCVKYFRDIGVSYNYWGGGESWQGIATSKNTLAQVAMLGTIYFLREVRLRWAEVGWRNIHVLYLMMAIYLLKGSPVTISMTSVAVCVFAGIVFFRIHSLRDRPESIAPFVRAVFGCTAALIAIVLVHSVVFFSEDSFFGYLITKFGRDITLTDRVHIWSDVYSAASKSPVFGIGFGGFWIGRLANIPWNASMTWVLGQAHSGYVDTYLQLGWVGGVLLAGVIFSTLPRLLAGFSENFDFACFRVTLFLTILFVNITESTYLRGDHHLWMIFMLVAWNVPEPVRVESEAAAAPIEAEFAEPDQETAVPV